MLIRSVGSSLSFEVSVFANLIIAVLLIIQLGEKSQSVNIKHRDHNHLNAIIELRRGALSKKTHQQEEQLFICDEFVSVDTA